MVLVPLCDPSGVSCLLAPLLTLRLRWKELERRPCIAFAACVTILTAMLPAVL